MIPELVKGRGVNPILIGFARTLGIIRVAHVIALGWVIACNKTHMVIDDHRFIVTVNDKIAVAYWLPPIGLVSDDEISGKELLSYGFNRNTAKVSTSA